MKNIEIVNKLKDGRFIFNKAGVHFSATKEQIEHMLRLAKEYENINLKSRKI